MKEKHTTKKGPGRRHVDGTYRGSILDKSKLPSEAPGSKLKRKAIKQTITLR